MQVTTRKLDDISLTSEYLRTGTDVESLKNSIQNVGLLRPGEQLPLGVHRHGVQEPHVLDAVL
ncbi:MAG: hypothetical protein AAFP22_21035, partial [Planctomycetota bacterium]